MKKIVRAEPATLSAPFANSKLGAALAALHRDGSTSQRQLAEFILRNPVRIGSTSIEDLARLAGVSPATVSRFARELGFDSYAGMRTGIADALLDVLAPVDKLRRTLAETAGRPGAVEILDVARQQLALIDADAIARQCANLASLIGKARSVHIMGFGLSAHVASLAVLGLQPYHPSVSAVVEFGGTEVAAGRLMSIGKAELLIAMTFPRYSSEVSALARYARDRGARVVAITDSVASPLASLADDLILSPAEHPVLSSSFVSAVAIVEAIVTSVMLSDARNVERADRLSDAIGAYLHGD
jgi:DNA-binding MurR/RpiR family transcriptional regulator